MQDPFFLASVDSPETVRFIKDVLDYMGYDERDFIEDVGGGRLIIRVFDNWRQERKLSILFKTLSNIQGLHDLEYVNTVH